MYKAYECIEDFEVEIYKDDKPTDEYFTVKKGSIWETNFKPVYGFSEIHLDICDENADYTWVEISYDKLNKCFKEIKNNG